MSMSERVDVACSANDSNRTENTYSTETKKRSMAYGIDDPKVAVGMWVVNQQLKRFKFDICW